MMNKSLLICMLLTLCASSFFTPAHAQNKEAMQPIAQLFDAMREHNGEKLLAQFTINATLERVTKDNKIKQSDLKDFSRIVSSATKYLDEQLLDVKIHVSHNLASAWTPFAFYVNGKLSHCGINSFQLVKQATQWKIQYLIDNVYTGDCKTFIKTHAAQ